MGYVALRRLNMGNGRFVEVGEPVPEANGWKNVRAWVDSGHIGGFPDPPEKASAPKASATAERTTRSASSAGPAPARTTRAAAAGNTAAAKNAAAVARGRKLAQDQADKRARAKLEREQAARDAAAVGAPHPAVAGDHPVSDSTAGHPPLPGEPGGPQADDAQPLNPTNAPTPEV